MDKRPGCQSRSHQGLHLETASRIATAHAHLRSNSCALIKLSENLTSYERETKMKILPDLPQSLLCLSLLWSPAQFMLELFSPLHEFIMEGLVFNS